MSDDAPPPAPTAGQDPVARDTYRHLRLILVALPTLLLVGTLLIFVVTGRFETSLSAYYLGPIRDTFVGAMIGIAVCLVAYRGDPPIEDFALNLAGFYAVFVALVPTGLAESLDGMGPAQRAETVDALRVTVIGALLVTAAFLLADWRTRQLSPQTLMATPKRRLAFLALGALWVAFVLLVFYRLVEGDAFGGVHLSAAYLLVVSLALAVASHGWPVDGQPTAFRATYRVLAILMLLGGVLLVVLRAAGWRYTTLFVEWYEIALFLVFWVLETRRTWNVPRPAPR
ncbi:hypothetical protein [Cellulomonas fimi]|uniref:DUF998 domain-containing protein n=1 Tax=Cellulomonas fimi (strain ATCC 484 / DSM 20113 / JCM 1341 / CCUG 24087 / LMG 16345 / NBRC 15513 / NCIMB 8980 / NCTC 7547 / NRS-133) TaxID=590998 RepID=F4H565_CELFA|nr:hypothetical protein [Cellulomonas fimi]AEE46671.1 hypothetical protein Celf_2546 [Cellulomonas fimi ATCC 484]NNH07684.1 hypothetical protein [Cellulomonas fimi]VEH33836.1 Uncharacterised protein [Cellulomonas fimi]